MSLLDRLRNLFEGPPRIPDPDLGEVDADLQEEWPDAAEEGAELAKAEAQPRVRDRFEPSITAFEDAGTESDTSGDDETQPGARP